MLFDCFLLWNSLSILKMQKWHIGSSPARKSCSLIRYNEVCQIPQRCPQSQKQVHTINLTLPPLHLWQLCPWTSSCSPCTYWSYSLGFGRDHSLVLVIQVNTFAICFHCCASNSIPKVLVFHHQSLTNPGRFRPWPSHDETGSHPRCCGVWSAPSQSNLLKRDQETL